MVSMWHGILILNKERGLTSHQAVAGLRRILQQAEVGHTGTLDPEATGVLVVGLGQATRSFPFLNENNKIYRAEIILGQATDTQDASGTVIKETPGFSVSLADLQQAIGGLTGELSQIPPMFSAVKINGRKLYDLARKGITVDRKPRPVTVFSWRILDPRPLYNFKDSVEVEISCSKGTYIRTLIHDLGAALGSGAHMGGLVRLRSGGFCLEDAITIAQVREELANGTLGSRVIPLSVALAGLKTLNINVEDFEKVKHGGKLSFEKYPLEAALGDIAKVVDDSARVIAIARLTDAGTHYYWQPAKVFNY